MFSATLMHQIVVFATKATPEVNPYHTTAFYISNFLQPCALPSWAIYTEYLIGLGFLLMFCQSCYILFVRSKTKKLYDVGLNRMGMIQLDRANHCALCYFCYSIIAIVEILCGHLAAIGHLDQAWPNFLLGIKCTITITCACVILWLCICHFSLEKQWTVSSHASTPATSRSAIIAWALNASLVVMLLISNVPILVSFSQLTMAYMRVINIVTPVINLLLQSASTYSTNKYVPTDLILKLIPLANAMSYIDLIVQFTQNGLICYVLIGSFICLLYLPFLFLLFESVCVRRHLPEELRQQQTEILVNTILELTIIILFVSCTCYALSVFHGGKFIFDPRFWISVRIGMNGTIVTFGNLVLFLIAHGIRRSHITREKIALHSQNSK